VDKAKREKLLDLFQSKLDRPMRTYLDVCTRCGLCKDACFAYASVPKPEYTPVWRAEVVRRIYKRYFKLSGRLFPFWGESKEIDEEALKQLNQAAYTCTGCRRCMMYCPFGIDTQAIQAIAKLLLIGNESEPEILSMLADASIEKGKSLDLYKESFIQGIKNLEKEVVARWKGESEQVIPLDVEGAHLLYVALAGAHSIIPAASIMNAARENWSLSFFEAVNFGAFVGDPRKTQLIAKRIIDEAIRLKVKEVVICECGTAFRVMKHLVGKQPFEVSHIAEVMARYLREKRIRVEKDRIKGLITYHDPCNIGRYGGVIQEPRNIIRALSSDFVEMEPSGAWNYCCGGGGGLAATGDYGQLRITMGKVKADQIRRTGAKVVVTNCYNCTTQIRELNDKYKLGIKVKSIVELVADCLEN